MQNDEPRSVRVEIDDAHEVALEIGEVESQPTGSSAVPIILGLIVVIILGLVLFGLSPDEDELADGTLRETPTTTAPTTAAPTATPTTTTAIDPVVVAPPTTTSGELAARRAAPALIPPDVGDGIVSARESELDVLLRSVVSTETGFLGLTRDAASSPQIVASTDGLSWVQVETAFLTRDGSSLSDFLVIELSKVANQSEDQFVLLAFDVAGGDSAFDDAPDGEQIRTQILTSVDGAIWQGVSTTEPQAERRVPRLLLGNSIISTVANGSCTGLSLLDLDGGSVSPLGSGVNAFSLGPNPFPELLPLEGGGIALYDVGTSSDGPCEGAVDVGPDRGPSIVLLDANTGSEAPFSLPVAATDVRLVGETDRLPGQAPYVLVEIDANLWALHPESGFWLQLTFEEGAAASPFYALSESGDRAYQLLGETLRVIDFEVGFGGDFLSTTQEDFPITSLLPDSTPPTTGFPFFTANVVFASDSLIMVSNDLGRLWLIDTPAALANAPRSFAEDFGGVGVAR